jgi:hypothetical protein
MPCSRGPNTFGYGLIESPTMWVGMGQLVRDTNPLIALPRKVFMAFGGKEGDDPAGVDKMVGIIRMVETNFKRPVTTTRISASSSTRSEAHGGCMGKATARCPPVHVRRLEGATGAAGDVTNPMAAATLLQPAIVISARRPSHCGRGPGYRSPTLIDCLDSTSVAVVAAPIISLETPRGGPCGPRHCC